MTEMSKILNKFEDFIAKVDGTINGETLDKMIGRWTVRDIMSHLTNWDRYSLDVMVPLMKDGAKLPEFVDHDEHNQIAIKGNYNLNAYKPFQLIEPSN